MKHLVLIAVVFGLVALAPSRRPAMSQQKETDVKAEAKAFLDQYQKQYAELSIESSLAWWAAANSGKKEDFEASAKAELALKTFHSNPQSYRKILALLESRDKLDPLDVRALRVAELTFKGNQLPADLLKKMVDAATEIERLFNTHRAELDGKKFSNNDLLDMLGKETDSSKRKAIWEALKQVGAEVAPNLIKLAKLRNQAATKLSYQNYWEMGIRLQEHDPARLLKIFAALERVTERPFRDMKRQLDAELARRFKIKPEQMMPWHYDNPFFQAAPPSEKVDLDEFYEKKQKEDIARIAVKFFADVGLPIDDIVARSDLYEREGKSQHAFCTSIDRADDVRTLCNLKPTAEWMDTMLHEQGHAVYDVGIRRSLPFNLRDPAHIFTTEGIAMTFGALGKNPTWMIDYAGADPRRVEQIKDAILEQRRREQLIFARWTMVMLHFERAMYEDPDRDLDKLWWEHVERYQLVPGPPGRTAPDWAAKPHFSVAPVYYHNYMLGELFGAQLRHVLARLAKHEGPASTLSFTGRKEFGAFLRDKVFRPGSSKPWPEFVRDVTGEGLSVKYYAEEVK